MILDISEKSKKINMTPLSFLCPGLAIVGLAALDPRAASKHHNGPAWGD